MTDLRVQPLTPEAFAPYGWMLGKPMPTDGSVPAFSNAATDFWQEHLFDAGEGGEPEILWVNYRDASREITSLEMHRLTQQAVVPLTGPIIQVVALSGVDGGPDLSTLAAFRVEPSKGICMRLGCWHATRVVEGEVMCLMLTRRSTTVDLIPQLINGFPIAESLVLPICKRRLVS